MEIDACNIALDLNAKFKNIQQQLAYCPIPRFDAEK